MKFRDLRADEIDVRIANIIKDYGCVLLLYKDARCDMNILDETVGNMNWRRLHTRDNANCIVSIWDEEKGWVEKEDTGTESYTEKEKGLASDSFKRSCVNWGIGRELYTSPNIFIGKGDFIVKEKNGKDTVNDKFIVEHIKTENGIITELEIKNTNSAINRVVFKYSAEKVICEKCGCAYGNGTKKDGSIWTITDMKRYSQRAFKKNLCIPCMKEEADKASG